MECHFGNEFHCVYFLNVCCNLILVLIGLQSKFLLPDDGGQYDVIKKWSMKDLGDKWTNWKHKLKNTYFDESKTAEHVVAKAPLDKVDVTQYTELVHYWYSEEAKVVVYAYSNML